MLRYRDAFVLAKTKLARRKIWTILLISLGVILFALVLFLTGCFRGFSRGLESYSYDGLNGQYLVTVANVRNNPDLVNQVEVWDLAEEIFAQENSRRMEIAKQFGLEYIASSELTPTVYEDGERVFRPQVPAAQEAIRRTMDGYLEAGLPELEKMLDGYDYEAIYPFEALGADGTVIELKNGSEDLKQYTSSSMSADNYRIFAGLNILDEAVYEDYLFDNVEVESDAIPVVLSVRDIEKYLGISEVSQDTSYSEKVAHIREIRDKARGLVIDACYRNEASRQLIFEAQQILDQIRRNEDNPNYVLPSLIYDLPTSACGAVTVRSDTRSEEEKKAVAVREEYQKALGEYEEPKQERLKFQVIGVIPTSSTGMKNDSLIGMIQSLGGVNIATPLVSREYYENHAEEIGCFYISATGDIDYMGLGERYLVKFDTASEAQRFIVEQSCTLKGGTYNRGCATEEKPFYLSAENNNSLVIDDITSMLSRIMVWLIVVVAAVTMLLIFFSVMRSIVSDRREIAIFRSIGFNRVQIMQVYLIYALMLVGMIVLGAVAVSLVVGCIVNLLGSGYFTEFLQATFMVVDGMSSVAIFVPQLWVYVVLVAVMIMVALIGAGASVLIKLRSSIIEGLKYE